MTIADLLEDVSSPKDSQNTMDAVFSFEPEALEKNKEDEITPQKDESR